MNNIAVAVAFAGLAITLTGCGISLAIANVTAVLTRIARQLERNGR